MRRFAFLILGLLWINAGQGRAADAIRCEGPHVAVEIDSQNGGITKIENKLTSDSKTISDIAFRLTTTRGELSPQNMKLTQTDRDSSSILFLFSGNVLEVELDYRLCGPDAVRKFLKIKNRGTDKVTIFHIEMFDWIIPGQWPYAYDRGGINQVIFHRGGVWFNNSINLFLRDASGGLFMGVENPFFEADYHFLRKVYPGQVEVGYDPNWILGPGSEFSSDAGFVGVYRQEKIYMAPPSRTYFSGRQRLPLEILDWGEVWAMQRYMECIFKPDETPNGEYYMACWNYADPGQLGKISQAKAAGKPLSAEDEAILKHFGGGPFDTDPQQLWYRLTPATAAFYKKVIDDAASLGNYHTIVIPNLMGGNSGWWESPEQAKDKKAIDALTDTWFTHPYPLWKEVSDYAAAKGMGMFTLELANRNYRRDKPEWKYLKAATTRTLENCYSNPEYVEWYTKKIDEALTQLGIRQWQWDEGWIDGFARAPGNYCYDDTHGHPAGRISYHQFYYVSQTLRTLKERHPTARFVIITGLLKGMPWLMKYLADDSNTGAPTTGALHGGAEIAGWFDRNFYFLPAYKCHREGGIHWIIERGSAGVERSDAPEYYLTLNDPERFAHYKQERDRWLSWAKDNIQFLRVRRDLFLSAETTNSLRGTAHMIGDRGFMFLHNGSDHPIGGQIPLNHWLGLSKGDKFHIQSIYHEDKELGVYQLDDLISIPVQPKQTLLLQVEATDAPLDRRLPDLPKDVPTLKAFLGLEEIMAFAEKMDFWPATSLTEEDKLEKAK